MADNFDIRLQIKMFGDPKFRRLRRLIGAEGQLALIQLWAKVALYHPKGRLSTWDDHDIADMAGWTGPPAAFIKGLVDEHWLDWDDNSQRFSVHDWREHQEWAWHSEERTANAREANNAKRRKQAEKKLKDAGATKKPRGKTAPVSSSVSAPVSCGKKTAQPPPPPPPPSPPPTGEGGGELVRINEALQSLADPAGQRWIAKMGKIGRDPS